MITKGKDKPVIAVTSTFPKEGKSYNTINIASSYALMRKKTVILLYTGANLAVLYAFMFTFRGELNLSASVFPAYIADNRSYFTVALGCTGGQHRSVWFAESLAGHFRVEQQVLVRHRELS